MLRAEIEHLEKFMSVMFITGRLHMTPKTLRPWSQYLLAHPQYFWGRYLTLFA